jgi:hypothetical protein
MYSRNRSLQHLQIRCNGGHSIMVQLVVADPDLIRLGAELVLVAHVSL